MKLLSSAEDAVTHLPEEEYKLLNKLAANPDEIELGPTDTEPNVRGRIRQMFGIYRTQRREGRLNGDLLVKLVREIKAYRLIDPGYFRDGLLTFNDVEEAVNDLPPPAHSKWQPWCGY